MVQPRSGPASAGRDLGLLLMFGPDPTPEERAAYWLVSDLGVVNRRLDHLAEDDLRAVLSRLCLRVIRGASRT